MVLALSEPTIHPEIDAAVAATIARAVARDPLAPPIPAAPEPVIVQATQTRRMSAADIEELRAWLIPRLMQRHPDRNYRAMHVFLVQALTSNESLFVRNDRAVALAVIQQRWLNPPQVVELFCFALGYPGHDAEPDPEDDAAVDLAREASASAASIYSAVVSWAGHMGVKRCVLAQNSDAARSTIVRMFAETRAESSLVVGVR